MPGESAYSSDGTARTPNRVWNPIEDEKRLLPLLENPEKSAELYQDMARTMQNEPPTKVEAMRYILAHGQEPDAAAWLAHEYGDMDAKPRIFTSPGAEQDLTLTWDEIKVRLSELIREGAFITPEEMDILNPDCLTGLKFQDALVKAMTERPYTESVTRGGLRYAVGGKISAELNVSGGVMKASLEIKNITDASVVYALTDAPTVRRVRMERGRCWTADALTAATG